VGGLLRGGLGDEVWWLREMQAMLLLLCMLCFLCVEVSRCREKQTDQSSID
jgi:hypothetical protein